MHLIEKHYRENFTRLVQKYKFAPGGGAEDIVHDAYEKALVRFDSYNPKLPFSNWFSALLSRSASDYMTKEKRRGMTPVSVSDDVVVEVLTQSIENIISAGKPEEMRELLSMITSEPPPIRNILHSYFVEQHTLKELANQYNISVAMAKKYVYQFRQKMKGQNDG